MFSRRQALVPLTAVLTTTAVDARVFIPRAPQPTGPSLPDHYDEPLGVGLESWPYPAPVHWRQCTVNGQSLRMAYMDIAPTGHANGRTVVLLHGKNFDSSYWSGPIKDLSGAGFRVVVPDQIGFNKSAKPDLDYSFAQLAELTIDLLGALQIGQAAVIGHSMGGMLAVRLASAFPQRVERLVLEDPIGLVDYRLYVPPQATETLVAAERRRTTVAYRNFLKAYFPVAAPTLYEPFVEWRMRLTQSGEFDRFCKAAALTYQMIYREPVRDLYAEIAARTLLIVGERDQAAPLIHYAPPEKAARMPSIPEAAVAAVKDLRDGRAFVVPKVGHVPHLEAPGAFRDQVLDFLA
jgi:pimeloyl-ACP methyl ester carboxylesterase